MSLPAHVLRNYIWNSYVNKILETGDLIITCSLLVTVKLSYFAYVLLVLAGLYSFMCSYSDTDVDGDC